MLPLPPDLPYAPPCPTPPSTSTTPPVRRWTHGCRRHGLAPCRTTPLLVIWSKTGWSDLPPRAPLQQLTSLAVRGSPACVLRWAWAMLTWINPAAIPSQPNHTTPQRKRQQPPLLKGAAGIRSSFLLGQLDQGHPPHMLNIVIKSAMSTVPSPLRSASHGVGPQLT